MPAPITIDSSSGGGQMLRNAVALSAVTGRPVRVTNIRGARPQPGLRPQHLLAVRSVAEICGAHLTGAEIGSREIEFHPSGIQAKADWRLDVGTAGSVTLILQCLLPALTHAPSQSSLTLIGGTDVPFSPPWGFFTEVFSPALAELGPRAQSRLAMRGFYPKGGGEVSASVTPASIAPISWTERGAITRIRGRSYSLGLPAHIAERMRAAALSALGEEARGKLLPNPEVDLEINVSGRSEGCGIVIWAESENGRRFAGSALGRRGKPAERVGEEAAHALLAELGSTAAVDTHLADQLIVWLALASGSSDFTTSRITDHVRSASQVAEAIAGARIELSDSAPPRVRCLPTQ
jgi:RNA 3'-phosphate cyclase